MSAMRKRATDPAARCTLQSQRLHPHEAAAVSPAPGATQTPAGSAQPAPGTAAPQSPGATAAPPQRPYTPPPKQFRLGAASSALVAQAHTQAAGGDFRPGGGDPRAGSENRAGEPAPVDRARAGAPRRKQPRPGGRHGAQGTRARHRGCGRAEFRVAPDRRLPAGPGAETGTPPRPNSTRRAWPRAERDLPAPRARMRLASDPLPGRRDSEAAGRSARSGAGSELACPAGAS